MLNFLVESLILILILQCVFLTKKIIRMINIAVYIYNHDNLCYNN